MTPSAAAKLDLPAWLRFPVNLTTGQVIVPTLLYLSDQCRMRRNSQAARNTLEAYAYDFRQWLAFLADSDVPFREANQETFNDWIIDLATDNVSRSTIRRKASAIGRLHADARARGLADFDLQIDLARDVGRRPEMTIRPISPQDIRRLRPFLGPRPSERVGPEAPSSRLRLACDIALYTGLRLFEIVALDLAQFEGLRPDPDRPNGEVPVPLNVSKGGFGGDAMFPNHLLSEIAIFSEEERGRRVGDGRNERALFTNHATSGRHAGGRMSTATLSGDFRRAVRAAGLLRPLPGAHRYGAGASATAHTFHDLRHTYAILSLLSLRGRVADPWNEVRIRMRHETSETTRKVYLRHLGEFERPVEDLVVASFRNMLQ